VYSYKSYKNRSKRIEKKKVKKSPCCAAGRWRHRRPLIPRWWRETWDSQRRRSSPTTIWTPWCCRSIARASAEFRTRGGTCWCAPRGKTCLHLLCNQRSGDNGKTVIERKKERADRARWSGLRGGRRRAPVFSAAIIFNKLSSYTRPRHGRGRRVEHPRSL